LANVAHSTLTGSDLHEPKGVASATSGQVYIADGVGSGAWSSASSALTITGQIADFWTLSPPSGWLECDGSAVSRTTYSALFTAVTIQQSGTRTNGSAVITGLTSTTHMRAGYYIGGTGITNGTKILTVDSATQVTMDANATSSGTGTCIISAGALGDGSTTFTLPDTTTAGRYRRSRYSTNSVGLTQADIVKDHTHSGTTSSNGSHSHTISITDPTHTHGISPTAQQASGSTFTSGGVGGASQVGASATAAASTGITASSDTVASHTHTITTGNQSVTGGTETRPITMVVLTCIRT
jgi:microcystin-dependent protein